MTLTFTLIPEARSGYSKAVLVSLFSLRLVAVGLFIERFFPGHQCDYKEIFKTVIANTSKSTLITTRQHLDPRGFFEMKN